MACVCVRFVLFIQYWVSAKLEIITLYYHISCIINKERQNYNATQPTFFLRYECKFALGKR